jgi:hypothetical protein
MTPASPKPLEHPPSLLERYELLRAAMLGAALPPDSRAGLIVLLHRGMWAWARVIDRIRHGPVPVTSALPSHLGEPCERRAVVHLLASMAMTITDRRPA